MKLLAMLIPALIVTFVAVPAVFADDDVKIEIEDGVAKVEIDGDDVKLGPTTRIIKRDVVIPATVITPMGEVHTFQRVETIQPVIKIETDD